MNKKYSKLTILKEVEKLILPSGQTNRAFLCLCDCGKEKVIRKSHLVTGKIKSCGCLKSQRQIDPLKTLFRSILNRTSENYFQKHRYFDKGIKVCDEWVLDRKLFFKWAKENGYRKGLQIDRIDNSKGYNPDNCRFVTPEINTNNRDNTFFVIYKKEKKSLILILREKGIENNYASIRGRIKRGWEHEKAIDTPVKIGNYKKG